MSRDETLYFKSPYDHDDPFLPELRQQHLDENSQIHNVCGMLIVTFLGSVIATAGFAFPSLLNTVEPL